MWKRHPDTAVSFERIGFPHVSSTLKQASARNCTHVSFSTIFFFGLSASRKYRDVSDMSGQMDELMDFNVQFKKKLKLLNVCIPKQYTVAFQLHIVQDRRPSIRWSRSFNLLWETSQETSPGADEYVAGKAGGSTNELDPPVYPIAYPMFLAMTLYFDALVHRSWRKATAMTTRSQY